MALVDDLRRLIEHPGDHCIEWTGYRDADGYGILMVDHRHWRAHRLARTIVDGTEPDGLVLHTCDNPPCVNPNHLIIGDASQNAWDREHRGRSRWRRQTPGQLDLNLE